MEQLSSKIEYKLSGSCQPITIHGTGRPEITLSFPKISLVNSRWRLLLRSTPPDHEQLSVYLKNINMKERSRIIHFDIYLRTTKKELVRFPHIFKFTSGSSYGGSILRPESWNIKEDEIEELILGIHFFEYPALPHIGKHSLFRLVNNPMGADLAFSVGSHILFAHQVIIIARMPHFTELLRATKKQSLGPSNIVPTLQVPIEVNPKGLLAFLTYLYTGSLPWNICQAQDLIVVANMYGDTYLRHLVAEHVCMTLSICNVADMFFSFGWQNGLLCSRMIEFIAQNYASISETRKFKDQFRAFIRSQPDPEVLEQLMGKLAEIANAEGRKRGGK